MPHCRRAVLTLVIASVISSTAAFAAEASAPAAANPLLEAWHGAHGGLPPFDTVKPEHFAPAIDAAMALSRREVDAIAANPSPASFDNTIVALERSGAVLRRVRSMYYIWSSSRSSPAFREIERSVGPKFAAYADEIVQNPRLWQRIQAVQNSPQAALGAEQQRLLLLTASEFRRAGAGLAEAGKKRVAEINSRITTLTIAFSQNLLADEEEQVLQVEDKAQLAGLTPAMVEAAAAEAQRRQLKGYAIANTRSAMEPFLTLAGSRSLREQGWRLWTWRGDHPDAADPRHGHDNGPLVVEILALRAERSRLLGFASYAHWRLADNMAGTPDKALDLLMQVWKPSVAAANADIAEMQALADADAPGVHIEPWDHRYYAEKLRRAKYAFDTDQLAPYLQMEQVRKAMFDMAGRLYGFRFRPVQGVPVFDRAMTVYEVLGRDGRHVGLWYFDPYARDGKNSGAWMAPIRLQQRQGGTVTPLVSNNCNFIAGRAGEPTLLSWDDAVTMFHEFGHALHGLLSSVTYASQASPNSLADFGEMPAQIHEKFLETPQALAFLVDRQGRAMPPALLERLQRAKNFNQGFMVTEFLASAIVDMKLHMSEQPVADPAAFERALASIGLPAAIVMRHRIPQFRHVFSGEPGYAAGYYGYQWASVLDRDAFEAFTETGNPYDAATARRLVDTMLARGNSVDPAAAFRRFRGRDPSVDAALRDKGFPVPPRAAASEPR